MHRSSALRFRTQIALTLSVLGIGLTARADEQFKTPVLPQIPAHTFKVTDYGLITDNTADNTSAIQSAVDAAARMGGGVVELPPGEYLSGPIHFASGVELRLPVGTTLKMLPMNRYPGGTVHPESFLSGKGLHDIAVTGGGTIDGQGAPWWPLAKTRKDAKRPRMIAFGGCERVLIANVKLLNSPMFHIACSGVSNMTVRGVTIHAPASSDPITPSHNTDACDISGTHILVQDCDVSVGDDDYTCAGGTSDVHIIHCTYGSGHGLSIGSPTKGGVSGITVEDCTFNNTDCGIRIKSDRDRGGTVQGLTYRNLRMTNVGIPILIYASYAAKEPQYRDLQNISAEIATKYPAQAVTGTTPIYRDINFSDITATVVKGHRAGLIWGLPEAAVSGIVLKNVDIRADKPLGLYNVQGVRIESCKIKTPEGDNQLSTANAQVTVVP
jgi:polygalacturonase